MRIAIAAVALLLRAQEVPDHPDKLKYPSLKFEVPDAAKIRTTLSTGTPAYLLEDPALPIVDLEEFSIFLDRNCRQSHIHRKGNSDTWSSWSLLDGW